MKKLLFLFLIFLVACTSLKTHYVSKGFLNNLSNGFTIEVSSDPKDLESLLKEVATQKLSLLVPILPAGDTNVIKIDFSTKGRIASDEDQGATLFNRKDTLPKKRHIYQSAKVTLTIVDKDGNEIYKVFYRYEGRNDFKTNYIQTPEEGMQECIERVVKIFEKDLRGKNV